MTTELLSYDQASEGHMGRSKADQEYQDKVAKAVNADTSPSTLELLAADSHPAVRLLALHNQTLPTDALRRLAHTDNPDVQKDLAEHRGTPADALVHLSAAKNFKTRHAVAKHDNTPEGVLALLALDVSEYVRSAAVRRLAAFKAGTTD